MHPRKTILLVAGLGLAALIACGGASDSPSGTASASPTKTAELNRIAPDFKLKDCFGKEFTASEFKGRIVVLEWINQGCPVSKGAHKKVQMQNIYRKYADRGVVWLGIDSTQGATAEKNRIYAAEMGLAYPILLDGEGKVGHSFQAKRTPHMFVLDREGKLVYEGAIDDQKDRNYVAEAIEDLLASRPISKPRTEAYGCGIKYAPAK